MRVWRIGTITSTLSSGNVPGNPFFITATSPPYDWRSPQNDNLWQGKTGINNPCPAGFRLPTADEWQAETDTWSSGDVAGAFASPLKLPAVGSRSNINGDVAGTGNFGYYWSSTVSTMAVTQAIALNFYGSGVTPAHLYRAFGLSVRCIQD